MSKILFILNDAPYASHKSENALLLAGELALRDEQEVRVFLIGDAALCARKQSSGNGHYAIDMLLKKMLNSRTEVVVCTACLDDKGLSEEDVIGEFGQSTLQELADWTLWADKVLVF